jgi:2-polyprenyl-3-methyl-5-hydroxy-6-metoxy-1,4-benzoquinol methylase
MIKNNNLDKMLEINHTQKKYYEFDTTAEFNHGGNTSTSMWNNLREYQYKMTDDINLNILLFEKHKIWLDNLENKKVLDLGCHTGNELSEYLSINSKDYFACDLSESALNVLKEKFDKNNLKNIITLPQDILSNKFQEKDFDVIYAKAVFHHFEYFEEFLIRIKSLLKPNGFIITSDPIDFYLPLKIVRKMYRPFQFDKHWEFPFDQNSIDLISKHFRILEIAGMMGKTKYAFPLYLINKNYAIKKSKEWVDYDLNQIKFNSKDMRNCLRISLKLALK